MWDASNTDTVDLRSLENGLVHILIAANLDPTELVWWQLKLEGVAMNGSE